ncbi:IS1096 element passenger TnpR family protein [Corynebacterium camporealensis]
MKTTGTLHIHVTLDHCHTPVNRGIAIPDDTTLTGLHDIIQRAFRWATYHLHSFSLPDHTELDPESTILSDAESQTPLEDCGSYPGWETSTALRRKPMPAMPCRLPAKRLTTTS